jgi:eukaryotic-like serine/threonine-protein kinase
VHADLKPGNILVTSDHEVKLIDFGQASAINQPKRRVQGTIDYMAPEQAARQMLDARTDVFGLGATLHRVFTGRPVATEMNQCLDVHSLGRIGVRVEDNAAAALDSLPPVLSKLIDDCCAKEPVRRPRDMREFIERCRIVRVVLAKQQETEEAIAENRPRNGQ